MTFGTFQNKKIITSCYCEVQGFRMRLQCIKISLNIVLIVVISDIWINLWVTFHSKIERKLKEVSFIWFTLFMQLLFSRQLNTFKPPNLLIVIQINNLKQNISHANYVKYVMVVFVVRHLIFKVIFFWYTEIINDNNENDIWKVNVLNCLEFVRLLLKLYTILVFYCI